MNKKTGLSLAFLHDFFEKNNIHKKTAKIINHGLKEDVFEVIDTEEKAYILGLLKTDGYVKKRKNSYCIGISLKEEDKYMVELIKNFFNASSALYHDTRPKKCCWAFECSSQKIGEDLSHFEIIPNKTYILSDIGIENIPEHL